MDELSHWPDQWEMSFNADKCKVMHIGFSYRYYMNGVKLGKEEKLKRRDKGGRERDN